MKTHLNDLFDQMEREEGNVLDDKIKTDEKIYKKYDNLMKKFEELDPRYLSLADIDHSLELMELNFSAKEITQFSMLSTDETVFKFRRINFGYLLTHLIKTSPDQNHTIHTKHLTKKISSFGISCSKNIKIYGNLGNYVGHYMIDGNIHVHGNVNAYLGYRMTGGKIIVDGTTQYDVGSKMTGGEILVKNLDTLYYTPENHYEILPNGYTKITPKR